MKICHVPLLHLSGPFFRAMRTDRWSDVLAAPASTSAGRYHRPGQKALYLTGKSDWATIAVGVYMLEDEQPRVVVPLTVDSAAVVDQRNPAVCEALGINPERSNLSWRDCLRRGEEPASWHASDQARLIGADGIVDRSRGIVAGWHMVLFDWNVPSRPSVTIAGSPSPADYAAARARWDSPPGWLRPYDRVGR